MRESRAKLTARSTVTSEPSSSSTRQVMMLLAVPAAGMCTDAPAVTTAGAWTTCCWWARSKGVPSSPPPAAPAPPSPPPPAAAPPPSRSSLSLVWKRLRERRLKVRRRKPIIFPPLGALVANRVRVLLHSPPAVAAAAAEASFSSSAAPRGRGVTEQAPGRLQGDQITPSSSGWMSGLQPHTNESRRGSTAVHSSSRVAARGASLSGGTLTTVTTVPQHTPTHPVRSSAVHLPACLLAPLAVAHRQRIPRRNLHLGAPQWDSQSSTRKIQRGE